MLALLAVALRRCSAACSQKPAATTAPGAATPPAAASAAARPRRRCSAVTTEQLKQAATPRNPPAPTKRPGDASLERMTAMPESAQLPGGRWKAGVQLPADRAGAAHLGRARPGRSAGSSAGWAARIARSSSPTSRPGARKARLREVRAGARDVGSRASCPCTAVLHAGGAGPGRPGAQGLRGNPPARQHAGARR